MQMNASLGGIVDLNMQLPFGDTSSPCGGASEDQTPWTEWTKPVNERFLTELVSRLKDAQPEIPYHLLELVDYCITRIDMETTRFTSLFSISSIVA